MYKLIHILLSILRNRFRSRASLEAENAVLRQQVGMLQQKTPGRIKPCFWDRLILVWLYRFCPAVLNVIQVVRPETVVRWRHRGFRSHWRRKSRARVGRPGIDQEVQSLIIRISRDNPLWGAPRIHSELRMLGFDVCQTTVAKYMVKDPKRRGGQSWKAFLQNHRDGVVTS